MKTEIQLELKPQQVYQSMIAQEEITTGNKSALPRDLTEDQIMERSDVRELIDSRVQAMTDICDLFFDGIIKSVSKLPYGIRWICKQLKTLSEANFPDASKDKILKVSSYFVFYRFINLAIVTPDSYEVVHRELPLAVRKNLTHVSIFSPLPSSSLPFCPTS